MRNMVTSALVALLVATSMAQAGTLYASRAAVSRVQVQINALKARDTRLGDRISALSEHVARLDADQYSTQQVINCLAGAAYYRLTPTSALEPCILIADVRGSHEH